MSHAITPTTPTTAAAVTALLSATVPDGSDVQAIESVVASLQALLNLCGISAKLVTGGEIGGDHSLTTIFENTILHNGQLACNGDTSLNTLEVLGAAEFTAPSRWTDRRFVFAANADLTKGIDDCDVVIVPAGLFTATRNLTLSRVNAVDDRSVMKVVTYDTAHNLVVQDAGVQVGHTMVRNAGNPMSSTFAFRGGVWVMESEIDT